MGCCKDFFGSSALLCAQFLVFIEQAFLQFVVRLRMLVLGCSDQRLGLLSLRLNKVLQVLGWNLSALVSVAYV